MSRKKDEKKVDGFSDEALLAISRALADPTRIQLLRRIATCESAACMDLRQAMTLNPATLSHHIHQLEAAGLIETRRDGKQVHASLRRKAWRNYLTHLKKLAAE